METKEKRNKAVLMIKGGFERVLSAKKMMQLVQKVKTELIDGGKHDIINWQDLENHADCCI